MSKIKTSWILVVIFFIAIGVRTYRLPDRIRWWSDTPRDFIVSKHLAFEGEQLINGHSASGVQISDGSAGQQKMLHYPTYYYWYLAYLWKFLGTIERIVLFNILLHSLAVFPFFFTLQLLNKNRVSNLLVSLIYAIAAFSVNNSLIIIGHHVSVPFIISGVFLFTYAWKKKNWWCSLVAILILTFITTFQYTLIVLIGLLCFALICRSILKATLVATASFSFFLVLHINQLKYYGFSTFITPFFHTNSPTILNNTPLIELLKQRLLNSRYEQLQLYSSIWVTLFFISCCFIFFLLNLKSRKTAFAWPIRFISLIILCYNILVLTKKEVVLSSYLLYADYAWLYLMSFVIPLFSFKYNKLGKVTGIAWIIFAAIVLSTSMAYLRSERIYNEYLQARDIAQYILDRYPPNIFFRIGSYYSKNIDDGVVGYWLETLSQQKIYKLSNEDRSYEFINPDLSSYILLCGKYRIEEARKLNYCERPQGYELQSVTDFPGYYMYRYSKINESSKEPSPASAVAKKGQDLK